MSSPNKDTQQEEVDYIPPNTRLPRKDEHVLKRRVNLERLQLKRKEQAAEKRAREAKKRAKKNQTITIKRPETIIREYRSTHRQGARMNRLETNWKYNDVEVSRKVAFVIRIRGTKQQLHPKIHRILGKLKLYREQNAVFVKLSPEMCRDLERIAPFVTWGYPSMETIKLLIYKRGFARKDETVVPIKDNVLIEDHFNDPDIVCVEDLIYELYNGGDHFGKVCQFLCTFRLSLPKNGFRKKNIQYEKGGSSGNRGADLNALIKEMI